MAQSVRDVMTPYPTSLPATASVIEAAGAMRKADIGALLVLDDSGRVCGIVTDRDIVVRAVATGQDMNTILVGDICSRDLTALAPTDTVEQAVRLMRHKAVRRLPVLEAGQPIGMVSIGDLAIAMAPESLLGDISTALPNR
jgi:CBS domain-containing protein